MLTTAGHGWPTDERTDRTCTSVEVVPPSTLSTLDANAWSEHLKSACVHGRLSRAVRADVVRRTTAGLMSLRDLRMVLYEAAVRETLDAVRATTGIARHGLVVKLITALRQVCNHPAHYLKEAFDPQAGPGAFAARSAKLAALDELLDQISALGESALIFSSYVEMGRLLQTHLSARGMRPEFVHGGTPVRTRQRLVDAFQAGDTPVLILSVKAAGVGLNLTRATHVIHTNPAIEDQATDRAHRIGQHRQVHVHQLLNDATLEDRNSALLVHKRGLSDAVLAGGEKALADLDDQELAQLVFLGKSAC